MRYPALFIAIFFAAMSLVPSLLGAAPVDSRITAVTVYLDRAVVTRTASVELGAGEQTLTFENLPSALNEQSLHAAGQGVEGASILDVGTSTVYAESAPNERVKELEGQIKALQLQARILDDRWKNLGQQQGFVERLLLTPASAGSGGSGNGADRAVPAVRASLDEWQNLLVYAEEKFGKIAAEQQAIDSQREELKAKQSALERQLNELRGARGRQSKAVRVRLALEKPGRLEIEIQYAIPNASWSPSYDTRLLSADRSVVLSYYGTVRNGTGEDWNNVSLTLSTAQPALGGNAPELQPWIADVRRPTGSGSFQNTASSKFTMTIPMAAPTYPEMPLSKLPESMASVEAGVTSATFKAPVTVSVAGNNVTQKVAIHTARFAATLQYQAAPKAIEAVFLTATSVNGSDYPLLAGPMSTFLDGTFVATSALKTVMPGERFDVALGADDGIRIKRRIVNRFQEETGFSNKGRRVTYEVLVTVTNNKTTPERLVFREPTPVSRDEKIVVKVVTPAEKEIGTLANPKEVTREEDGKIVWRVNLKPGEKREFPLKVSVEYPADVPVVGLE